MLNLFFVEAALELVPRRIIHHPSVVNNARKEGKKPEETLLDRSLHHRVMIGLNEEEKRGRPDIIHFCLLESLGSPLNREGNLSIAIHTIGGTSIEVNHETRLPRDANRFRSLIERLLIEGQVPPLPAKPLLKAGKETLHEIKEKVNPSLTIALTSHGTPTTLENLCGKLAKERNPLAFIGAYPHGEYRKETLAEADEAYSIYPEPLEAWVVTSRFIYEYEKQLKALGEATRTP